VPFQSLYETSFSKCRPFRGSDRFSYLTQGFRPWLTHAAPPALEHGGNEIQQDLKESRAVPEMVYPRGTRLKACSSTVGGYSNYGTAIAFSQKHTTRSRRVAKILFENVSALSRE